PSGADATFGLRDLHGVGGLRLRLGVEGGALYHYRSIVQRVGLDGQGEFADGAGTFDVQFGYEGWVDQHQGSMCDPTQYVTCFGSAEGNRFEAGGSLGY